MMIKILNNLKLYLLIFVGLISPNLIYSQGSGATINISESRCVATGSIEAIGAIGVGPFTYDFVTYPQDYAYTGPTNSNLITALNPGNYVLRIIDEGAGFLFTDYNITVPGTYVEPTYNPTATSVTNCINGLNGSISGNLIDGRAPFYYEIIAGPMGIGTISNNGTFNNLGAGTYTVRGYDSCGNFQTRQVTIDNFDWSLSNPGITKIGCGQYSFNSINISPALSGQNYSVKNGNTVLASGASLPITFSNPDNTIGNVKVCVTDSCGTEKCVNFSVSDWSISSSNATYVSCNTFSLNSVTISGSPIGPLTYGFIRGTGDTVWSNTIPFTFGNQIIPEYFWGLAIVKDGCGVIKKTPKVSDRFMQTAWVNTSIVYSSCTESNVTAIASWNYMNPVTFELDGGTPITVNDNYTFQNIPDGSHTIKMTDSCGNSRTAYITVTHDWTKKIGGSSYPYCEVGKVSNYVTVNRMMKSPITYKEWDSTYSTLLATATYSDTSNTFKYNNDQYANVSFGSRLPNTTYNYIVTDACGRTDTVTIMTGSGHQQNTLTAIVTPLCIGKGNISGNYQSDNPNWNPRILKFYKYDGANWVLENTQNMNNNSGTYNYTNKSAGLYKVVMTSPYCYDSVQKIVTIDQYTLPKLKKSLAFACAQSTVEVVGNTNGGLAPYNYEIIQTIPSGGEKAPQASPIFTVNGNYTLIRLRVVDACGNTSLQDVAVRPPAQPKMKINQKLPNCNLNQLELWIDSSIVQQTYEWRDPSNNIVSTSPKYTINNLSMADTGLYTCRVLIQGTCYDVTSTFRLREKDLKCYAKLGNYVWLDNNQNGIQDAGEVGVSGVTVTLYDNNNKVVAATVTDALGYYIFDNLIAGTYHVGFTLPVNYVFSPSNQGGDDEKDSDPNPSTGLTGDYTLVVGDSNMSVDAGIYFIQPIKASLGDYVWYDLNHDGIQDVNELGVSGVTVTLFDSDGTIVGTTITDATGHYLFQEITPATYSVGFSLPIGYIFSPKDQGANDELDSDVDPITGKTSNVTIIAGENNMTLDAGIFAQQNNTASLGDFVWNDKNNNGIQEPGETGVRGVTVKLYDNNNNLISTTVTDEFGYYIFNNLTPSDYIVEFTNLPVGYYFSPQNQGGNDIKDSDPDQLTGKTSVITLLPGDKNMTIDAGIYNPNNYLGALGDYVWYDYNKNGIQDNGEIGVPGVTVTLYDENNNILAVTATDETGYYLFNNLNHGNFQVKFSNLPLGYKLTTKNQGVDDSKDSDPNPATGITDVVSLLQGEVNITVDAGIVLSNGRIGTATLGDKVWYDTDNDGIQDEDEFGVSGITVTLFDNNNNVIATQVTDALGNYLFTNLPAGSYRVGFSNLPGYSFSSKNQGGNDELDSDADPITGLTDLIYLSEGEDNLSIDAGIHSNPNLAGLGDYVWNDLNQDGVQDLNEPGVPGVTVTLYDSNRNAISSTTTNSNGKYQFTGLTPGTYYVEFTNLPNGFEFTQKLAGGDDGLDSDADPISGETQWITLSPGEFYPKLDAGIYTDKAGLGNYVWNDLNADGIQDPNEPGIPGVLVMLYAADGITPISSAITDASGHYSFINLEPGTYVVGFSNIPEGSTFTKSLQGGNVALDSDPNVNTGKTSPVTLVSGEYNPTIDAGVIISPNAGLGNYVWLDLNANGIQDLNEPSVSGVTVTLYDENGVAIKLAVTDSRGFYSFPNLKPGTYSVGFSTLPNNTGFTQANMGDNDSLDSDVITIDFKQNGLPNWGKTTPVTIVNGEYNPTIDAGLVLQFPLGLVNIEANAVLNKDISTVNWVTSNEENLNHFDIERSVDNRNFVKVGNMISKGTTVGNTYYSIKDNVSTLLNLDVIYYRVKAIDNDGQFVYSNTVSVNPRHSNNNEVVIFPVPFESEISIAYNSIDESELNIQITDIHGKLVSEFQKGIVAGQNSITISGLEHLARGNYSIRIVDINLNQIFVKKITKK